MVQQAAEVFPSIINPNTLGKPPCGEGRPSGTIKTSAGHNIVNIVVQKQPTSFDWLDSVTIFGETKPT